MQHRLSKVADFNPPHLHLAPMLGMTPLEFFFTKANGLSCGVVWVILDLGLLIQYRVWQTHISHRHTDTGRRHIGLYRASIASRGKNWNDCDSGYVLDPLFDNMTSSTKPEVHSAGRRTQLVQNGMRIGDVLSSGNILRSQFGAAIWCMEITTTRYDQWLR